MCVGFAGEHSDCAPIPGSALAMGERAGRPNGALHGDQEVSHASAEPSAAHTVELWESVRHTEGVGRGVVRISEIPARAAGQLGMLALVEEEPTARSDTVQRVVQPPNVIGALDCGTEGTSLVTRQRGERCRS
jgi:hypothetical protein